MRGKDINTGKLADPLRVVERHAIGRTGPPVVAGDEELLEAQSRHDLDLILGHAPE
jgi:hypothetical protein